MNVILQNIIYFILPLVIAGLMVKYLFKSSIFILLPSAIMFLLFVIITLCSLFTSNKFETELFTLFCTLQVLALIGGIFFMSKQEILWKHFFVSLAFQLFYWLQLFYYGGLQFTHKFEV